MSTAHFSFDKNEYCSYNVFDNLIIHFECMNDGFIRENDTSKETHMYFTDDNGHYINVPNNIVVYKLGQTKSSVEITVPKPITVPIRTRKITTYTTTYYSLYSTEHYEIHCNDSPILCIEPLQYCWKFVNYKLTDFKSSSACSDFSCIR